MEAPVTDSGHPLSHTWSQTSQEDLIQFSDKWTAEIKICGVATPQQVACQKPGQPLVAVVTNPQPSPSRHSHPSNHDNDQEQAASHPGKPL